MEPHFSAAHRKAITPPIVNSSQCASRTFLAAYDQPLSIRKTAFRPLNPLPHAGRAFPCGKETAPGISIRLPASPEYCPRRNILCAGLKIFLDSVPAGCYSFSVMNYPTAISCQFSKLPSRVSGSPLRLNFHPAGPTTMETTNVLSSFRTPRIRVFDLKSHISSRFPASHACIGLACKTEHPPHSKHKNATMDRSFPTNAACILPPFRCQGHIGQNGHHKSDFSVSDKNTKQLVNVVGNLAENAKNYARRATKSWFLGAIGNVS